MVKRKKKTSLRMRREEEGWAVTSLKGGEGRAVGEDYPERRRRKSGR